MHRTNSISLTVLAAILATPILFGSGNTARYMAIMLAAAQTARAEAPFVNADVIKLSKMGLGDEIVIAKINQAKVVDFQLETDDLAKLMEQHISKSIIAAMFKRATPQAGVTSGQLDKKVQEPEFLGTFFLIDSTTGNLIPLERQTPAQNAKIKGFGLGGVEMSMIISGDKSPVRFKEGQKLNFVVLSSSQQIDPQGLVHLFSLDSAKAERHFQVAKVGFSGGGDKSQASAIQFNASKYGISSFMITPAEDLVQGEYLLSGAFSSASFGGLSGPSNDGFCFGIDPDPSNPTSRPGQIVPFRTGEAIPLGFMKRNVTFQSAQVTAWPKPADLQAAQNLPNGTSSLTVKFTYSNPGKQEWSCKYQVAILDDKGVEIGTGERVASLGGEQKSDTNRVSVKMKTLDFPKAAKLRVHVGLVRKVDD